MTLDIMPLANAVQRLREGLRRCERNPNDDQIRDGLIHRFELTYELSHKMLKRYLKQTAPSPTELDRMPFADLIRSGNALGLLRSDWPAWRRFREMRARTSHAYKAQIASEVVAAIRDLGIRLGRNRQRNPPFRSRLSHRCRPTVEPGRDRDTGEGLQRKRLALQGRSRRLPQHRCSLSDDYRGRAPCCADLPLPLTGYSDSVGINQF
jgi:nucleotidyltransferase substrate binding protein (TIGR01987 family)